LFDGVNAGQIYFMQYKKPVVYIMNDGSTDLKKFNDIKKLFTVRLNKTRVINDVRS